jgi:hypothetical protein
MRAESKIPVIHIEAGPPKPAQIFPIEIMAWIAMSVFAVLLLGILGMVFLASWKGKHERR